MKRITVISVRSDYKSLLLTTAGLQIQPNRKTSLAGITIESGGTLTLNGNGTIEIFNPADVIIAVGGIFNYNYGKINVVNPFMPN